MPLCPQAVRIFAGPGSLSLRLLPHLYFQGRAKGERSSVSLRFFFRKNSKDIYSLRKTERKIKPSKRQV